MANLFKQLRIGRICFYAFALRITRTQILFFQQHQRPIRSVRPTIYKCVFVGRCRNVHWWFCVPTWVSASIGTCVAIFLIRICAHYLKMIQNGRWLGHVLRIAYKTYLEFNCGRHVTSAGFYVSMPITYGNHVVVAIALSVPVDGRVVFYTLHSKTYIYEYKQWNERGSQANRVEYSCIWLMRSCCTI